MIGAYKPESRSRSLLLDLSVYARSDRFASCRIEFFTIDVSVKLSYRSLLREEQKQIVKNCPQSVLKPGPPDHENNNQFIVFMKSGSTSANLSTLFNFYRSFL